jgi:hypothetical protein
MRKMIAWVFLIVSTNPGGPRVESYFPQKASVASAKNLCASRSGGGGRRITTDYAAGERSRRGLNTVD